MEPLKMRQSNYTIYQDTNPSLLPSESVKLWNQTQYFLTKLFGETQDCVNATASKLTTGQTSCKSIPQSQQAASDGVIVSKLDEQTYTSEFESYWVPHSYGLVPHLSKKLCKLLPSNQPLKVILVSRRWSLKYADQSRLGFELGLPIPFPISLTVTLSAGCLMRPI